MLYDVVHRELPALVLTVDDVMAELDGSAQATRSSAVAPFPPGATGDPAAPDLPVYPTATASRPRLLIMGAVALVLLGATAYLRQGPGPAAPAQFKPVGSAESAELQASLTGVYLTGNQPGHHGIVFISARELKLFELGAVSAPRTVHASSELGRVGPQLVLATDQPGGLIEVTDHDTLVYCGEVYRRIP
jgi:hypothetical protein